MLKKCLSVLILMTLVATVTVGCGGKSTAPQGSDKKEYTLKLGHNVTPGSDVDMGAQKFKELVEKKTNGQVKINVFPAAQLGSELDMVKNMGMGAIDIVIPGDGIFGSYAPKFQALVVPFVFSSVEHMDKVYKGEIGKQLDAAFRSSTKSTVLAVWHRGPRNITANREIKTPDDLRGLKLRVTTIPIVVAAWTAMGANPTPIAFPELFVALQQGVVDGQENPLDLIYTSKFQEVQKYLVLTQHTYSPWLLMMNTDKYNSFPPEIRKQIDEAAAEATTYQNSLVKESEAKYLKMLKDAGVKVIEVDKSLFTKRFIDNGVEQKLAEKYPEVPDLFKRIREAK